MLRHLTASWCIAAALGLLCGAPRVADGGEADVAIEAVEGWSALFGGTRATLHFTVTARRPFRGRLGWALAYEQRTLVRREQPQPTTIGPIRSGDHGSGRCSAR